MVQTDFNTDQSKLQRRQANIRAIKELMREFRARSEIYVNKAQFELSLANQMGISVRMVQIYLGELETQEFIIVDKPSNEIIFKRKLDK